MTPPVAHNIYIFLQVVTHPIFLDGQKVVLLMVDIKYQLKIYLLTSLMYPLLFLFLIFFFFALGHLEIQKSPGARQGGDPVTCLADKRESVI